VEAGQLSRALTLTEMGVRGDGTPDDDTCDCSTGRADLTFINVGYQFKTNNPATPDATGSLFGGTGSNNLDLTTPAGADNPSAETTSTVVKTWGAPDTPAEANKPTPPAEKFSQIKSKVETFLFDLYSRLDKDHQPYEKALRGDTGGLEETSVQRAPIDLFTGRDTDPTRGAFAPPFGSMNRSGLGDPVATAQQATSAANDLKKAFSDFGENLSKNTKKAELGQEITNLKGLIDRLTKRLNDVNAQNKAGNVTIGNTDSKESLERQLAEAQRELANKQAELARL